MATSDLPSRVLGLAQPSDGGGESFDAKTWLAQTTGEMRESFARNRRVITLDEGALYKFNWIFPSQKLTKGGIGFGGGFEHGSTQETFAYLDDELIESKITDEMRDHPLLLLPRGKRRELVTRRLAAVVSSG